MHNEKIDNESIRNLLKINLNDENRKGNLNEPSSEIIKNCK